MYHAGLMAMGFVGSSAPLTCLLSYDLPILPRGVARTGPKGVLISNLGISRGQFLEPMEC